MNRKLAHIERITTLTPIIGADSIEVAQVLGWNCVVKRGEFQVGDLVVYCEIDSILPEKPEFEFLRSRNFRVKTIKLRGQVSQGICFPLTILTGLKYPEDTRENPTYVWKEGQDVTSLLGVTKYEEYIPANLSGLVKGKFPSFLHKTDEIRIQAVPQVINRHAQIPFYVTEKIDGSSCTIYLTDGVFGVCSRNLELTESENNAYWKAARNLKIEEKLRALGQNISLQGELYGNGVQGNKYQLSASEGLHIALFNIYYIDQQKYADLVQFEQIAKQLDLETVPILDRAFLLKDSVADMVQYSIGSSVLNNQVQREGLVFRPHTHIHDPEIGRLSFKVINPQFLLKYGG